MHRYHVIFKSVLKYLLLPKFIIMVKNYILFSRLSRYAENYLVSIHPTIFSIALSNYLLLSGCNLVPNGQHPSIPACSPLSSDNYLSILNFYRINSLASMRLTL